MTLVVLLLFSARLVVTVELQGGAQQARAGALQVVQAFAPGT